MYEKEFFFNFNVLFNCMKFLYLSAKKSLMPFMDRTFMFFINKSTNNVLIIVVKVVKTTIYGK